MVRALGSSANLVGASSTVVGIICLPLNERGFKVCSKIKGRGGTVPPARIVGGRSYVCNNGLQMLYIGQYR